MTEFGVFAAVTASRRDGSALHKDPQTTEVQVWEDDHRPDSTELLDIALNKLPPEFDREQIHSAIEAFQTGIVGERRLTDVGVDDFPQVFFEERVRSDELKIKRRRKLEKLGWKTIQVASISELLGIAKEARSSEYGLPTKEQLDEAEQMLSPYEEILELTAAERPFLIRKIATDLAFFESKLFESPGDTVMWGRYSEDAAISGVIAARKLGQGIINTELFFGTAEEVEKFEDDFLSAGQEPED